MPTSVYFNSGSHTNATLEKFLLEDLINEFIKIHGVDVYLIPRESMQSDIDWIYGEDPLKKFDKAFCIEMYPKDVDGWKGAGDFFSKFGLELRDDGTFIVARSAFLRYVPTQYNRSGGGPREGDLIWFPLTHTMFEIKHTEEETEFFALGKKTPYFYELSCERFKYSEEVFNTGDSVLDDEMLSYAYAVQMQLSVSGANGSFYRGEQVYQGANLASATAYGTLVVFDKPNATMNIAHIKGSFVGNTAIRGANSNASYILVSEDDISDSIADDIIDNKRIEDEANVIVNFSEDNPFGGL
jgi:hypothetical protein